MTNEREGGGSARRLLHLLVRCIALVTGGAGDAVVGLVLRNFLLIVLTLVLSRSLRTDPRSPPSPPSLEAR